jgi:hypothetical protein
MSVFRKIATGSRPAISTKVHIPVDGLPTEMQTACQLIIPEMERIPAAERRGLCRDG